MPVDRQLEKRRQKLLKTAYLAAVLAGCTISTASYAQTTREWEGDSGITPTVYNIPNNWTPTGTPTASDQAVFGTIAGASQTVDIGTVTTLIDPIFSTVTTLVVPATETVDHIYFSNGANRQEFNLEINSGSSLLVNGNSGFGSGYLGIVNDSGLSQTFNVNGGTQLLAASIPAGSVGGGTLNFDGNSTITNTGVGSQVFINTTGNAYGSGTVNFNGQSSAGDENVTITNETDGTTNFNNSSNAGSANIVNQNGGHTTFNSTDATEFSSADNATITNSTTGDTTFNGYATAGSATITNDDGGTTTFNDNSDGYSANIVNNAGGTTVFNDTSSADRGLDDTRTTITNSSTGGSFGVTEFNNSATAGEARITNNDGGRLFFNGDSDTVFSSAGNSRITNNNGGETEFNSYSTADNAIIVNYDGGQTDFDDNSTAGDALIVNNDGGWTSFDDASTAGDALIFNGDGGETHFHDSAQANNATIVNFSGGLTHFEGTSQGNTATVVNLTGGTLENDVAGLTLGHVRGGGNVILNGGLTLDSTGTDNPTRNDIISGVISGVGGLTKEGENIVRLSGENTYTGDTNINNGVLSLSGSITSNTFINRGGGELGELRGNGTITGNLTNAGGRLVTGDTLGDPYSTLTVNGNFDSANGDSIFVSRVGDDGIGTTSNSLRVNGTATLGGAVQVQVDDSPGTVYLVNNQFTLVETDGSSLTGTFSGVTSEDALVNPSSIPDGLNLELTDNGVDINGGLSYTGTAAYLHLNRTSLDDLIDGVDLTRNQRAAYNSLNVADFGDLSDYQEEVINQFIIGSSEAGSSTAASLISGDALTAFPVAAQGAATRFNQRILSQAANGIKPNAEEYAANRAPRMVYTGTRFSSLLAQSDGAARNDAAAAAAASRSSIWATIARAKEDTDSDGNGPGFDARATEYQVGYNRKISDRTVAGISIGKSDADITIDDRSARGDLDTTSIAAYFRHDNDDLYFSGLLSYSRHDIDSRRATSPFDTATGDYDARTIGLWGEVGKKMERGSLAIEPHISLKLSNTKQDSFSESGFGGLDVDSEKYNTRRLGLGVRVATNSATARFRPYGFVGYEREFGDERAELTNSVAGLSSFRVRGSDLGKNIWALRLGTDARINDRFSVVGEIGASWRKNQDSRYIYGGVKYGW